MTSETEAAARSPLKRVVLRRELIPVEVNASEIAEWWAWAWHAAWCKWLHDDVYSFWPWQKNKRRVAQLMMHRCKLRSNKAAERCAVARREEEAQNARISDDAT